ncbi:hypothetical protein [Pantoea endophytica]|uniref:hypothetical protein n=1 Tax=Pantoea endophytica TaxID=92488 RepID=UPI0030180D0D
MTVNINMQTLIKVVRYEWHELMRDTDKHAIVFRVVCSITAHSGLSVEGSHIFTIHNITHTEDKNALALTSESAAYNNSIQCLTAALAFSGQNQDMVKKELV